MLEVKSSNPRSTTSEFDLLQKDGEEWTIPLLATDEKMDLNYETTEYSYKDDANLEEG